MFHRLRTHTANILPWLKLNGQSELISHTERSEKEKKITKTQLPKKADESCERTRDTHKTKQKQKKNNQLKHV